MSIFKCPVCGLKLIRQTKSYQCPENHVFDISSKGYVNLLLANQRNSKDPGDNKQMILSRRDFLNKGYYSHLSKTINSLVLDCRSKSDAGFTILDAGCGEGYYLSSLEKELLENSLDSGIFGFDISKEAVKAASSRSKALSLAVAGSYNIPVLSNSVDCLLEIFSPYCDREFSRIIKAKGIFICVMPGRKHLLGLKKVLYDNPYENDEEEYPFPSFERLDKIRVKKQIVLDSHEDIQHLLKMTPYFWKTGQEKIHKLDFIDRLETETEFILYVYSKKVK